MKLQLMFTNLYNPVFNVSLFVDSKITINKSVINCKFNIYLFIEPTTGDSQTHVHSKVCGMRLRSFWDSCMCC